MTTLTVVEDPGVPGRFNVSGSGLDFTVNITNERIDITGADHSVEVTVVGGRANIRWFMENYVSRNNMGQACLPDPADPFIYSLSGVTGEMNGTDLDGANGGIICQSTNALYVKSGTNIYKIGLGGHTELNDVFAGASGTHFASVAEDKIYGIAISGSNMVLNLYDYSDDSTTELYSNALELAESLRSLIVIGDPGAEKLVAISSYRISTDRYGAVFRVFDTEGNLERKDLVAFVQITYGTNTLYESGIFSLQPPAHLSPQICDEKIIITAYEQWNHYPNIPYHAPDFYYFTDVIIYNPSTGTSAITRVENDLNLFRYISVMEVGIDYEYSYFYWFETQSEPTYTPPIKESRLYRVPVSSASITLVETIDKSDYLRFVIGKSNLYGIRYVSGNITKVPTAESAGSVPAEMHPLDTADGRNMASQLDETDQRIWFTDGSELYGVSVDGAARKDITLNDGTQVTTPILSFNQVKNGVAFTSATELGLSEG